jgi:hypothetical protein
LQAPAQRGQAHRDDHGERGGLPEPGGSVKLGEYGVEDGASQGCGWVTAWIARPVTRYPPSVTNCIRASTEIADPRFSQFSNEHAIGPAPSPIGTSAPPAAGRSAPGARGAAAAQGLDDDLGYWPAGWPAKSAEVS